MNFYVTTGYKAVLPTLVMSLAARVNVLIVSFKQLVI